MAWYEHLLGGLGMLVCVGYIVVAVVYYTSVVVGSDADIRDDMIKRRWFKWNSGWR